MSNMELRKYAAPATRGRQFCFQGDGVFCRWLASLIPPMCPLDLEECNSTVERDCPSDCLVCRDLTEFIYGLKDSDEMAEVMLPFLESTR